MKVDLVLWGSFISFFSISGSTPWMLCKQDELRTIRKNCTRCIAQVDERICLQYSVPYHISGFFQQRQVSRRLIADLRESDDFIRACIAVHEYRLQEELRKPLPERNQGYCWLLDAQLSFYNSLRALIPLYIKRVRTHFSSSVLSLIASG